MGLSTEGLSGATEKLAKPRPMRQTSNSRASFETIIQLGSRHTDRKQPLNPIIDPRARTTAAPNPFVAPIYLIQQHGLRVESLRLDVRPHSKSNDRLHEPQPCRDGAEDAREANAGCNRYNRYLAIAARVVRRSLKEDKRLAAERRGESDLRFAKWEVSHIYGSCERGSSRIVGCVSAERSLTAHRTGSRARTRA